MERIAHALMSRAASLALRLGVRQWRLAAVWLPLSAVPDVTAVAGVGPHMQVDVLVYGGTAAGVIAAYTAKQYGRSVLLIEPGRHLGGMSSGGLGYTDIGNKHAVTGLGLDFYRRVGHYYGRFESWTFEPHVAEQVLEQYVDRAAVETLFSRRVKRVDRRNTRIRAVTLEYAGSGAGAPDLVVAAKVFIDASYEGDLMARAGASYTVGREPNSRYNETLNGVQLQAVEEVMVNGLPWLRGHQFPDGVDPYVIPGQPSSGLLPGVGAQAVAPAGSGDEKVQAYNFRMTLCQGEQRLPIEKPERYDPGRYELLIRSMEKHPWKQLDFEGFIISLMPNGKSDWNNWGALSTDYIGGSWDYPEADYARREEIRGEHELYQKGLLYFIATDPRVPAHVRDEMRSWGYCRDEFLDTGGWPHQLYVREARRLVGEYVMTEHNVRGEVTVEDGIGMAAYTMDSHNTQRLVVDGMTRNEGNVEAGGFAPYPIAYRSITPKRHEVTNLLVPVALSASHIAYGSIRMEPVFMVLGQSAAVAASMAIEAGVPVQQVNVPALQRELTANPLADHSPAEVLIDDSSKEQIQVSGTWTDVQIRGQYGQSVLRSDRDGGSVRFVPRIREPGMYQVYLYWPAATGLASNVPIEIQHATGAAHIALDQRRTGESVQGSVSWQALGEYRFEPTRNAWVEIGTSGVDGAVLADAVLFLPARKL
ncbi:MAG TPA: FAD-dependent oxidoreductase [Steroidobacter sp.]|uniref:FAD-dependent oxidoreductase n=1 Tax=Steroidobacter sp. TaxID=1978227 RepID=UPI002EDB4C16